MRDSRLRKLEREWAATGDQVVFTRLQKERQRAELCPDCGVKPPKDHIFCLKCQPITLIWNLYEIVKNQAEFLREEDPELTEEEAFNQADRFDYYHEWEYFAGSLGELVEKLNPYEYDWLPSDPYRGPYSWADGIEWSTGRIREKSGTESYYVEVGNAFLRAIRAPDQDIDIIYDGESITVDGNRFVPGIPCEECDVPYSTQEEADNCCHLCEICEEAHKTEEEAKNCCFVCPHCKSVTAWGSEIPTVYNTKEEMEDCCHLCLDCGDAHDTKEEAHGCCDRINKV